MVLEKKDVEKQKKELKQLLIKLANEKNPPKDFLHEKRNREFVDLIVKKLDKPECSYRGDCTFYKEKLLFDGLKETMCDNRNTIFPRRRQICSMFMEKFKQGLDSITPKKYYDLPFYEKESPMAKAIGIMQYFDFLDLREKGFYPDKNDYSPDGKIPETGIMLIFKKDRKQDESFDLKF